MRLSFLTAFVIAGVFAFSTSAMTQDKPAGGGQKEHTMGGCLMKGDVAGTYVVQNVAEKGPKVIGIVESKDKLEPHLGHHIDITGTAVPPADVATMKGVPKADHHMRITAVKMVAATCPAKK
jgi:hypothetical protein